LDIQAVPYLVNIIYPNAVKSAMTRFWQNTEKLHISSSFLKAFPCTVRLLRSLKTDCIHITACEFLELSRLFLSIIISYSCGNIIVASHEQFLTEIPQGKLFGTNYVRDHWDSLSLRTARWGCRVQRLLSPFYGRNVIPELRQVFDGVYDEL